MRPPVPPTSTWNGVRRTGWQGERQPEAFERATGGRAAGGRAPSGGVRGAVTRLVATWSAAAAHRPEVQPRRSGSCWPSSSGTWTRSPTSASRPCTGASPTPGRSGPRSTGWRDARRNQPPFELSEMADDLDGGQPPLTPTAGRELSELGEKIFLDRYALKDASKATLAAGDLVVVCRHRHRPAERLARNATVTDDDMAVRLARQSERGSRTPWTSRWRPCRANVARGARHRRRGLNARGRLGSSARWLLSDWALRTRARIPTPRGHGRSSPLQLLRASRRRATPARHVDTRPQMMAIMSPAAGVAINISQPCRPRHATCAAVNGRSAERLLARCTLRHRTDRAGRQPGAAPCMRVCDVWAPRGPGVPRRQREMGKITNATRVGTPTRS